MFTRKLYATGSATGNAVGQLTIPSKTTLVGVQWGVRYDMVADNSILQLELSYASASQIAVNDAQSCIASVGVFGNLVTSGFVHGGINQYMPVHAPFNQGQFLYAHALVTTCTYYLEAVLWFK